ncbi:rod shape-determining protein MreD [Arenibacterium halophilum]|uniref:Rod shape-determining protein MreD n=1 Tax=Arenibacterium halophilum TaxID=2583821 RepID=A0ABY2X7V8_9RHOB|nr:rod shape-determining protein MreD [Arenibacterium halophilum]TMV11879.1 rod shape-determining protein MreD [Arenibacterium halophilum]
MADYSAPHVWSRRIVFVLLVVAIIFFHLIPLDTVPRRWAPPDLILAFAFAWVMRRPDYVPALSLALMMLMADLLFQRPPGLMALLVVLGAEYLKSRVYAPGDSSFVVEWIAVAAVMVAIAVLNRLTLTLLLVPMPPLSPTVIQMVLTIAVYPLVVFVSQTVMGVRKPTPSDAGAIGGRA